MWRFWDGFSYLSRSSWNAKPGAIISVSPGALAGFGANHHLRQSLVFLNVYAMQQPETYLGGAGDILDENDQINNERTEKYLQNFIDSFASWIAYFK